MMKERCSRNKATLNNQKVIEGTGTRHLGNEIGPADELPNRRANKSHVWGNLLDCRR